MSFRAEIEAWWNDARAWFLGSFRSLTIWFNALCAIVLAYIPAHFTLELTAVSIAGNLILRYKTDKAVKDK